MNGGVTIKIKCCKLHCTQRISINLIVRVCSRQTDITAMKMSANTLNAEIQYKVDIKKTLHIKYNTSEIECGFHSSKRISGAKENLFVLDVSVFGMNICVFLKFSLQIAIYQVFLRNSHSYKIVERIPWYNSIQFIHQWKAHELGRKIVSLLMFAMIRDECLYTY